MEASVPNLAAAAEPSYRSLTTARPIATPPPATTPCPSRSTTRAGPVGASAQPSETRVNSAAQVSSSRRRPRPSLTGPSASCPTAMPTMNAVRVSWATAAVVPSDSRSSGSAAT